MNKIDPTKRFSKTVENYLLYRPGYPPQIVDFIKEEFELDSNAVIADIGSGTGKLTELFLNNGNPVFAVEPNNEMRHAAERLFDGYANFQSIAGTAEETSLASKTVDFIIAGQAFHWFQPQKAKLEFQRILKENGKILLIWNNRMDGKSAFMKAYDDFLIAYATDYEETNLRKTDHKALADFYAPDKLRQKDFLHFQSFDLQGLIGRYLSCSYAFDPEHLKHEEAINVLSSIFARFQENGIVKMWYRAEVYFA